MSPLGWWSRTYVTLDLIVVYDRNCGSVWFAGIHSDNNWGHLKWSKCFFVYLRGDICKILKFKNCFEYCWRLIKHISSCCWSWMLHLLVVYDLKLVMPYNPNQQWSWWWFDKCVVYKQECISVWSSLNNGYRTWQKSMLAFVWHLCNNFKHSIGICKAILSSRPVGTLPRIASSVNSSA